MNKFYRFLIVASIIPPLLFSCSKKGILGQLDAPAMLQPGAKIDDMVITTGAEDAVPLWAFCSPAQHSGNTSISDCVVPTIPRLAIGHFIMTGDNTLNRLDWSEISWELNIDNQPIDLSSFGTNDFVLPVMPYDSSSVREVFVHYTAWDVVLTNLSAGEHTLQGVARAGNDHYSWIVHLSIEGKGVGTQIPWAGSDFQATF